MKERKFTRPKPAELLELLRTLKFQVKNELLYIFYQKFSRHSPFLQFFLTEMIYIIVKACHVHQLAKFGA